MARRLVVGGLGLAGSVVAVVSFNRCRASSIGTVARGALARVEPGGVAG